MLTYSQADHCDLTYSQADHCDLTYSQADHCDLTYSQADHCDLTYSQADHCDLTYSQADHCDLTYSQADHCDLTYSQADHCDGSDTGQLCVIVKFVDVFDKTPKRSVSLVYVQNTYVTKLQCLPCVRAEYVCDKTPVSPLCTCRILLDGC